MARLTVAAYRRLLDGVSQIVVAKTLRTVLSVWRRPDLEDDGAEAQKAAQLDQLVSRLAPVVRDARVQAHDAALRFLGDQAKAQGVGGSIYEPPLDGYADQGLRSALAELDGRANLLSLEPREVATRVANVTVRHTEGAARDTVRRAAEDAPEGWKAEDFRPAALAGLRELDGDELVDAVPTKSTPVRYALGYARMLTGTDNCPFCVMLASRGPVYRQTTAVATTDSAGDERRYHDSCDCIAVPVYNAKTWPGADTHEKLASVYYAAQEAVGDDELIPNSNTPPQLQKLRKYLASNTDALVFLEQIRSLL